jgi:lipoate-protein ligase B
VTAPALHVLDAGLVPYGEALAWQRRLAAARIERRLDHDVLLLLEHPPVITLGRTARREHVLQPADVEVFEIERGGDVTFHGPGQLVGYPILDLSAHRRDLHWYLRTLEAALIGALGRLGITADRRAGRTGVWVGGSRKIASIGVHVKHWVTWHGFALNVTTDLSFFDRIVPCGMADVEMTSVARELGLRDDRRPACVAAVMDGFREAFRVPIVETSRAGVEV